VAHALAGPASSTKPASAAKTTPVVDALDRCQARRLRSTRHVARHLG
jgi:hypothetical protein